MDKLKLVCVGVISFLLLGSSISAFGQRISTENPIIIEVSIPPMVEWVEAVGGKYVRVSSLLNDHQYPDGRPLDEAIIDRLVDVNMLITLGTLSFEVPEELVEIKRRFRGLRIRSLTRSEEARKLVLENEGSKLAPIWMSPSRAKAFVKEIQRFLTEVDPEHRDYYEDRAKNYLIRLTDLEDEYDDVFRGLSNKSVMTYYPFFDYLAHDYGFFQVAFEGSAINGVDVSSILEALEAAELRSIIFTYQFGMQQAAELAEEFDGNIVFINPLDPNYIENMMAISRILTLHFQ